MNGQTVDAARRALTARFKSASIDSAELDARMLVGAVLGLDLTGLISAAGRRLTADESIRLEDFARRRLGGEPVARILGAKEFWGLPLTLSAATLVPRPDTETVVELALEMLRASPAPDRPLRIADLGTGSGAILLALLSELPGAIGIGTDISVAALADRARQRRPISDWPIAPISSPAIMRLRCRALSISLSRTRPTSARPISPGSPPRSGISTRLARSTAAATDLTPIAR